MSTIVRVDLVSQIVGVRPCGATVKAARARTPVPGPPAAKDHAEGAPLSRTGRPEATPARSH